MIQRNPVFQAKDTTMKATLAVITIIFNILCIEAELQNCTTSSCNLQTCSTTSSMCRQRCFTNKCNMSCSSPAGCDAVCEAGGCQKISCDIPYSSGTRQLCYQTCEKNCPEMRCKSQSCFQACRGDNCKMDCLQSVKGSMTTFTDCYTKCNGKGCEINIRSFYTETSCDGGSCRIKFDKESRGYVLCEAGNCTLICAKGSLCRFRRACPNCTGPIFVDDPFSPSNGDNTNSADMTKRPVSSMLIMALVFILLHV